MKSIIFANAKTEKMTIQIDESDMLGDDRRMIDTPYVGIVGFFKANPKSNPSTDKKTKMDYKCNVQHAEVQPKCDVCGLPCFVYPWCHYCYQGPVMHHGRCCWYNPGRRNSCSVMTYDDSTIS